MAACLISITGTSGSLILNYTISSVSYSIQTSIGSFYIDDAATDVTYTTISGDIVASSLCLTITEQPMSCYSISWSGLYINDYIANAIFLGYGVDGEITITNTNFPNSKNWLAEAINSAGDDRVKAIAYNIDTSETDTVFTYILQVIGNERPDLQVRNADDTQHIYIHGVPTSCTIPENYEIVNTCYSFDSTTTTTAPL